MKSRGTLVVSACWFGDATHPVAALENSKVHTFVQNGYKVSGIMGTSAGALSGSLYAAGYSPAEVRP
jgi:hypothetical protein